MSDLKQKSQDFKPEWKSRASRFFGEHPVLSILSAVAGAVLILFSVVYGAALFEVGLDRPLLVRVSFYLGLACIILAFIWGRDEWTRQQRREHQEALEKERQQGR